MNIFSLGLYDIISEWGEQKVESLISSFKCSLDPDAESFLKKSSIKHEKKGISRTYIVFEKDDFENLHIIGYYTLAVKCFAVYDEHTMPENLIAMMNVNRNIAQAYLLGQLAKADETEKGFGKIMMNAALDAFKGGYDTFGCRTVRLDCKSVPNLIQYYESQGFISIGKNHDNTLNQMVMIM